MERALQCILTIMTTDRTPRRTTITVQSDHPNGQSYVALFKVSPDGIQVKQSIERDTSKMSGFLSLPRLTMTEIRNWAPGKLTYFAVRELPK